MIHLALMEIHKSLQTATLDGCNDRGCSNSLTLAVASVKFPKLLKSHIISVEQSHPVDVCFKKRQYETVQVSQFSSKTRIPIAIVFSLGRADQLETV